MKPAMLTITGPSCTGKTTLQAALEKLGFAGAVSSTTRFPRTGEVHGKDYYFIHPNIVKSLEWAECITFNDQTYGLTDFEVQRLFEKQGKPIVFVCEPIGVQQIGDYCKKTGIRKFSIYLDNDPFVLYRRMTERLLNEYDANPSKEENIIKSFTSRYVSLANEYNTWYTSYRSQYDLYVKGFTPENTTQTVMFILEQWNIFLNK